MSDSAPTLQQLGWKPFFQQQLSLDELTDFTIGRMVEQHRGHLVVMTEQGQAKLTLPPNQDRTCVGDWVLFDDSLRVHRSLERQSLFERKAPGTKVSTQLIASNVDTVMIVSSLNRDFSLERIERYLSLAHEAGVEPVVVLTKADLCEDPDNKRAQVQAFDSMLAVYSVNALDKQALKQIESYCQVGKTLAFLGSSGVGKSTLVNSLMGIEVQQTGEIRDADSKGRHTTTHRALKVMPQGGLLMDTPGMRELQLGSSEQGVNETFSEISELAEQCRFNDCSHASEPGCAIQRAIKDGTLSERRLLSYQKLMREQEFNGATLAEKRSGDKAFGKMIKNVMKVKQHNKE